jgi:hypothetical protein
LPDTDLECLFVEAPDIIPQVTLQQIRHLILQHLSLPFFTIRSDSHHERPTTTRSKNNEKSNIEFRAQSSQRMRDLKLSILREIVKEIRGVKATSSNSEKSIRFFSGHIVLGKKVSNLLYHSVQ